MGGEIMYEAKITSKGQITIPIEIRRHLNLQSGDKMSFKIKENGVLLDKSSRPLTIQERFVNYDLYQSQVDEAMKEINTGEALGEEKL